MAIRICKFEKNLVCICSLIDLCASPGEELEHFDRACKMLMDRIRGIIPEGSTRARIRCTNRVTINPHDGRLADTLGDEARGMLVVDLDGHPHKYDHLEVMSNIIAKEVNILKVDVPEQQTGRGWQRTDTEISTQELGESWREEVSSGAKYVLRETKVKANEPHYVC